MTATTLVGKYFHGSISSRVTDDTVGVFGHVEGDLGNGFLQIRFYSWHTRELRPGIAVTHLTQAAAGEWEFLDTEAELFVIIDELSADDAEGTTAPNIVPLHGKPH